MTVRLSVGKGSTTALFGILVRQVVSAFSSAFPNTAALLQVSGMPFHFLSIVFFGTLCQLHKSSIARYMLGTPYEATPDQFIRLMALIT